MKILCDVGNTFTTMLFIDNNVRLKKICTTKFPKFIKKYSYDEIYISCVVNEVEKEVYKYVRSIRFIRSKDLGKYVKIKYNIKNIGVDRILNVFFVKEIFGGSSCIVSLGTAIVIDYINKKCEYVGGEIFPGLKILSKGLYNYTSKLPFVDLKDSKIGVPNDYINLIGNDTRDCIKKGIINFCFSGIKNFVDILKPKNLIITGGDGKKFFNIFDFGKKTKIIFIKNLVILGIILWCYYKGSLSSEEFEKSIDKIFIIKK